jgi:hypothetical protein
MATTDDADGDGADDGFVSQEQYEQETRETGDITLTTGGKMRVQQVKPLEVVKAAQEYGVQSILREGTGVDRDELVGDGDETGIGPFMDNFVAPRIVRPNAYWSDPSDDIEPGDGFDLSVLDEDDLSTVVRGIMAQGGEAGDGDPTDQGNDTTSGETR